MTARDRRLRLVDPPQPSENTEADAGHGIEVSADVVRVVGAATVMRLRAEGCLRQEYRCPFCDRPPRGTASLIVFRYAHGLSVVRLAHATCSPSAVLRILSAPTPAGHRVRASCWLRPLGGGSASAVLLVDNQVRAWPRHRAREARDGYARALETAGFTPAVDLDGDLPAPPGLTVTLTSTGDDGAIRIRVTHPSAVVHDGTADVPDPWLRQAHRSRTVTVVTGTGILAGVTRRRAVGDDDRRLVDGVTASLVEGRIWSAAAILAAPVQEHCRESRGALDRRCR